jgi:hypothetical protein
VLVLFVLWLGRFYRWWLTDATRLADKMLSFLRWHIISGNSPVRCASANGSGEQDSTDAVF